VRRDAVPGRLPEPGYRRGPAALLRPRSRCAGVGPARSRRGPEHADAAGLAPGRQRRADPPDLRRVAGALAREPQLGAPASAAHGGHGRAAVHREVGIRPAASRPGAVGLPERPCPEPGRVLRPDHLLDRDGVDAAAPVAPAGKHCVPDARRARGVQPALPREALALGRRRWRGHRHGLPAADDLAHRGRCARLLRGPGRGRAPVDRAGRSIPLS
jgi:hypothetical protein